MQTSLKNKIDTRNLPEHVAIIMDGNGRWAKKKGMMRTFGHKNAIKAVRAAIESCEDLNIRYLTLFAFSSENWSRPLEEVSFLMNLLIKSLKDELETLKKNKIRLKTIGEIKTLPKNVYNELMSVVNETQHNTAFTLTLALSYGAKDEILHAVKNIAKDVKNQELTLEEINPELFKTYLFTADLPDVDLMIRTSGETRISNFLLWQIAYAELYFTDVLWPDFRKDDFYKAILSYQGRERRFGKTGEQLKQEKI